VSEFRAASYGSRVICCHSRLKKHGPDFRASTQVTTPSRSLSKILLFEATRNQPHPKNAARTNVVARAASPPGCIVPAKSLVQSFAECYCLLLGRWECLRNNSLFVTSRPKEYRHQSPPASAKFDNCTDFAAPTPHVPFPSISTGKKRQIASIQAIFFSNPLINCTTCADCKERREGSMTNPSMLPDEQPSSRVWFFVICHSQRGQTRVTRHFLF